MLTTRQRNFPDLLFLVQCKGFGSGFVPGVGTEDNTDGVAVPVPTAEYLVELSGVPGTPTVSMFESRKHLDPEPSERMVNCQVSFPSEKGCCEETLIVSS